MRKLDKAVRSPIDNSRPFPLAACQSLTFGGRPKDFAELGTIVREGGYYKAALLSFLREFYCFKEPQFFAFEPPDFLSTQEKAWLAGVAEYLCHRFGLPVPAWVERPQYFLNEFWQKTDDAGALEFKRRNIGFNPRHLVRL